MNEADFNTKPDLISKTEFLNQISDFNNHIDFIERLLKKYDFKSDEKNKICQQLEQIKRKQDDKLLNLSVIGEFSTGKSSLINAMIRSDLLTSSDLQGTTVASVTINYSKNYSIELYFKDKTSKIEEYSNIDTFKDALVECSTLPDIAQNLNRVVVNFPATNLENRFRIIDTPGTNATENWHEDVTIYTIQEISDVSIILVDATKPLPDSLCTFILNNLKSVLPQCVFVVTKMDLLRKKERDRMLAYIKNKIEHTFDIKNPIVLPYAAAEVIKDINKEEDIDVDLVKASYENEEILISHMMNCRLVSQSKKLIGLADHIYFSMGKEIEEITADYEEKLSKLLKTKNTDLTTFIIKEKELRKKEYLDWAMPGREYFKNHFYTLSQQAQQFILARINSIQTIEIMNNYCQNILNNDIIEASKIIINNAGNFQNAFSQGFIASIEAFQSDFESLFKNLDILQIKLDRRDFRMPAINAYNAGIDSVSNYVSTAVKKGDEVSNNAMKIVGLAGLVLFGPLGGVAGAVGGKVIGSIFGGPNIQEVKANVLQKVSGPLRDKFNEVANNLCETVAYCIGGYCDGIDSEIDRYLNTYQETVDKQIEEQQNKKKFIQKKLDELHVDMGYINDKRVVLANIGKQLDVIN